MVRYHHLSLHIHFPTHVLINQLTHFAMYSHIHLSLHNSFHPYLLLSKDLIFYLTISMYIIYTSTINLCK